MIKINKLEIENVKRVKAVKLEPNPTGLTVIGGRNGQGKTSVVAAIHTSKRRTSSITMRYATSLATTSSPNA